VIPQVDIPHNPIPNRRRILLFALPVLTFLAYLPALHGSFIWDDDRHVSANPTLRNLQGLAHIWLRPGDLPQYYPMTYTSFWLEYRLWGTDPLGYHVDNVLLHIASAILLWQLLRRLHVCGAALAAVIFALHPIEVESVAWISERKNLLSTFFALLSLLAYLRNDDRRWPVKAFLLFVLAMLSKTVASTLPAVMLVILWWKRGRVRVRDVVRLLPFFAVSIGLGLFTAYTEVDHVGAKGPDWNLSLLQRCLIACRALWFYLAKLVWPVDLVFSYPRWEIDPHHLWLFLFPAAAIGLAGSLCLLRCRLGRGPLAAIMIFAGVLMPALGFFNTYPMRYSFVADHFQYSAGIAIIALACAALVRMFPQRFLIPIFALILGVLTWRQAHVYAGPEALWRDVLAKNSASWMADENLGVLLAYKQQPTNAELEEAVRLFERVHQLRPQHEKLQANWAEALFKLRRWSEALPHYQAAHHSPGISEQLLDDRIGKTLEHLNRWREAETLFAAAIDRDGSDTIARCGLADALAAQGRTTQAMTEYDAVLKAHPDSSDALKGSGLMLMALGHSTEAADRLNRYVALEPKDAEARVRLARLELQLGRPGEAVKQFAAALSLEPDSQEAQKGLAEAISAEAGH
jgi:tetratricopeptide (TPR) repeat protein